MSPTNSASIARQDEQTGPQQLATPTRLVSVNLLDYESVVDLQRNSAMDDFGFDEVARRPSRDTGLGPGLPAVTPAGHVGALGFPSLTPPSSTLASDTPVAPPPPSTLEYHAAERSPASYNPFDEVPPRRPRRECLTYNTGESYVNYRTANPFLAGATAGEDRVSEATGLYGQPRSGYGPLTGPPRDWTDGPRSVRWEMSGKRQGGAGPEGTVLEPSMGKCSEAAGQVRAVDRLVAIDSDPVTPPPPPRRSAATIKLETFTGSTPLETFLTKVDNCAEYYSWTDSDRLHHLRASLEARRSSTVGRRSPDLG